MGKLRVLLVDDEEAVARGFSRVLEASGCETERASNGREAARLLEVAPFDVMVVDLFMPEREGLETIQEAHVLYPDMRIVAASGGFVHGELTMWLGMARAFGAAEALKKPVAAADLIRAVRGGRPASGGAGADAGSHRADAEEPPSRR